MIRWEGENNESVYEKCGIETCANGVVELVKRYTLSWFSHIEIMNSEEFVRKKKSLNDIESVIGKEYHFKNERIR